ncbi:MAG: hypothetical protein DIU64_003080 [Caldicoprobacter oshimai]
MIYEIDTSKARPLNWGAKGVDRILQNILNLISTWRYEIAYNRTQGIDPSILDRPPQVAAALYIAEISRVISEYEPRAAVQEVNYLGTDENGHMQFKVVVEI